MEFIALLIIVFVLVGAAIILLGVKVFFTRNGRFPNGHIGSSKAMKDRGITCATSQDREAQKTSSTTNVVNSNIS